MEFNTQFSVHSQTSRLQEDSCASGGITGFTLSMGSALGRSEVHET